MHGSILKQLNNGKPRWAEGLERASRRGQAQRLCNKCREAGAYCTVGLVSYKGQKIRQNKTYDLFDQGPHIEEEKKNTHQLFPSSLVSCQWRQNTQFCSTVCGQTLAVNSIR